ncbi:MAG: hybrid sensor histidine kinase/response regulator [Lentimicrobiaceae bacterium]|nr:hybrid sensor histidine kinase/response regulator [Lentimicrobiaceae bacterium]
MMSLFFIFAIMKGINRQYESRVKQNAVIIYLLASLLCIGMIYYIVNLKKSINLQKENIERNEEILNITNSIIGNVNKAQAYANLYTHSANKIHLNNFNITLTRIKSLNDSIVRYNDNYDKNTLNQIISLLKRKENIIKEISTQFSAFNPYKEIYAIVENYQPKANNTTISTTIQDTIIYKSEKKGFFQRLSDVFSPDKTSDSIVLVSKTIIDTIIEEDGETQKLIEEIQLHTNTGRNNYIKQIEKVEAKYNNLILNDQEISKEISVLLIKLHKDTLDSVMNEIHDSEVMMNKNINLSILIAIIALCVILTFIFFIFSDVKKVVAARKATEEAKRRTEEIMESRHKLLLSVSHDIKAPLSSILGYLELMQIDNNNAEEKRMIASMRNSSEHILSLLSNLLNFSRLDQGKETIILSIFNIGELCNELCEMFAPIAEKKHLSFIYENKLNNSCFVKSDALKIKQILSNLLSNAIKYTLKGNINFSIRNNDKELIFNVTDNGIGIPQDKLNEIFKPFSRLDNQESIIEGNGFGLFVVKGLIDLLNGDIEVSSKLDIGSTFIVRIPVDFVKDRIDNQEITYNSEKRILVIDDDDTLLSVIESMLKKINIRCDICHSSLEFDEYCKSLDLYDIILTDREMGAFNGLEALKKVKEINPEKKVILMTARSEYNEHIAKGKGFDGYLRKPFSIKDIATLFNSEIVIEQDSDDKSKYYNDFPKLCNMFDNDDDIKNILKSFVATTSDNLLIFNKIITDNDFDKAVNLCHKMYPMFVQLSQDEAAEFLFKMDKMRGKDSESFPDWRDRSIDFMNNVDEFISYLSDRYDIE